MHDGVLLRHRDTRSKIVVLRFIVSLRMNNCVKSSLCATTPITLPDK